MNRMDSVDVVIGDLFESPAQTWVNTVNTVGVMGKGVALEFKKRFPDMVEDYEGRCLRGEVRLGEPYLYRRESPPHILNFPTKGHWRAVSRLKDIVAGLRHLERHCVEWGITSLAVPPLGCGHGGLEWSVVGPTLYNHLAQLDIPVELYAPHGTPHEELQPRFLQLTLESAGSGDSSAALGAPKLEPGWVALVAVLDRLQLDPHHWPVGKTTFQKLAYFAGAAGIPTELRFEKGTYGPYAEGLTRVVSRLVNHDLLEQRQLCSAIVPPGDLHVPSLGVEVAARTFERREDLACPLPLPRAADRQRRPGHLPMPDRASPFAP